MKKKVDYIEALFHFCLVITILILIWTFIEPKVDTFNWFMQGIVIIITGIGGLALYIPIGVKLIELKEKYGK